MAKGDVHTVPHYEGWANEREGATRASSVHATKEPAVEAGRLTAKRDRVEHLIVQNRALEAIELRPVLPLSRRPLCRCLGPTV
jgi:hypothetical protein